jgi:DNA-binding beta-propeller fold protein YncE
LGGATLGVLCALLCPAPVALAGPPSHASLPERNIEGLNHACGVAGDSAGDLYASSAGESKIKIFDETHTEIGEITEGLLGKEPCGLAVDTNGNLYVSEQATGQVVKYHPTAYPFSGSPSYQPPLPVDASGNARGIAVDPVDDSLYVAEGSRVTIYRSDGSLFTEEGGFDGHLTGFTDATGIASYTYLGTENFHKRRYVSVADAGTGQIQVFLGRFGPVGVAFLPGTLEQRATIDGSETPEGELGLASTGAYLGLDSANGHVFAYDAAHKALNEFEATGAYFTRIVDPQFADAQPTAVAIDRAGGVDDGVVYVTAGASAGADLLAFSPVVSPGRRNLPDLSRPEFTGACGVAVDSEGDIYVAGTTKIAIYGPDGNERGSFLDVEHPCQLAVDSEGNLYAIEQGSLTTGGDEKVFLYEPSAFPFSGAPSYGQPKTIESGKSPEGLAVNPVNDHLFVAHAGGFGVREYAAAREGSGLLKTSFCGFGSGSTYGIDVYAKTGDVYVLEATGASQLIDVCSADGSKVLTRIDGSGSPHGAFSDLSGVQLAVNQSNGHVLVGEMGGGTGTVEEYEASGTFVADFGSFTHPANPGKRGDIALDNSEGPTNGNLYVSYDDPAPGTFDLTAFGPLSYGELPVATTGLASGVGATGATLTGTVDPGGFKLEECAFEWGEVGQPYEHKDPCAETSAQIGEGEEPVAVHLDLSGIEPQTKRYRYRLIAKNKYGTSEGEEGRFGPPLVTTSPAQPIFYREAALRAKIDPTGLATEYRYQYLPEAQYLANGETFAGAQSTLTMTIGAASDPSEVEALLTGLEEGTTYYFQLIAENEAAMVEGAVQTLSTQERHPRLECANQTLRLENNSAGLPDCRAYELVTPADTRGFLRAEESAVFNDWLVTPYGQHAGESLAFYLRHTTLPGAEGDGLQEAFRATRRNTESGWSSASFGPSTAQKGEDSGPAIQLDVAPDQLYSFWQIAEAGAPGTLPPGRYLRTPGGFEAIGRGNLGEDLKAKPDYVNAGGSHVIFSSSEYLEEGAAPQGTMTIYDRAAGTSQAQVVSLKPDGSAFDVGEDASYLGATLDGSSVAFEAGGSLYVWAAGTAATVKVANAPFRFAGVSADGRRVFYTDNQDVDNLTGLWVCEVEAGSCPASSTEIATGAKFAVVSADGSRAYFTKEGSLYAWDDSETKLVSALASNDVGVGAIFRFPRTNESEAVSLDAWTHFCANGPEGDHGRATCPLRTTPDGRFLVFQSHADLTPPYEGQGHSEIYRYDAVQGSLLCVSCDPSGVPAGAEADLQSYGHFGSDGFSPVFATTLIPGISDDGSRVFFQTSAALLPEDANSTLDVYEWQAQGTGGCDRAKGCLALISSGQGDNPSWIYSMSPDGHDVFFSTFEKLISADIAGSPSIYDARIGGGFPQPTQSESCHGDACQGEATPALTRTTVRSDAVDPGNVGGHPRRACPKGKHAIRRNGKTRCVKASKHRRKRARHRRRTQR